MIRLVKRCLGNSKLEEHKWDGHFAFAHFSDFTNIFLNGKPLKWHNIFRNGDVIELIERPAGAFIKGLFGVSRPKPVVPPIPQPEQRRDATDRPPEITGADNKESKEIIPYVFGEAQQTAFYGQQPYKLVDDGGATNIYNQYFVSNYNNVVYSDYKLGEAPVTDYSVDYLDITTSLGGTTFIGFDNVKVIEQDEELSYNKDEQVNQTAAFIYNQSTTSTSLQLDFELEFTNVDISNWADKTFELRVEVLDNTSSTVQLTENYTITSGDVTLVSGTTYSYTNSKTWTQNITELVETEFSPTANTRGNSIENTNQLNSTYIEQEITTDDFNTTTVLNQSINRYEGTVSEVVATSPDDTEEIDVIIKFPQGLYKSSGGTKTSRSVNIDIDFKTQSGSYKPISDANALYVRDLQGNKQPLSSSTTTVSGSTVTMYSPNDINQSDALFFRPIGMELDADIYSVRIRSADFADRDDDDIGTPYCDEVHFRVDGDVLDTDILPNVNQIAFKATAYKGLSGTLKKFNYIADARVPIWDGVDWDTTDKTTNPAAIVRHLLTSELVNPRSESVDDIDNDSLVNLYNWCESEAYKASGVISTQVKIGEIISKILENCQALMIPLLDGKHTFVIDQPNKTPVGLFNQHNSFNFSWTPVIGRQTEAIRATFVNNDTYVEDELTVYYYNGAVYEVPEAGKTDSDYEIIKKDFKYVNDRASVLKIVTYELTTIQEKRNEFQFDVNLEALNLKIYDRCYLSNSANMQDEVTGLIKSVNSHGGNITGFELYSFIDIPTGANIIIRSLDYTNEQPIINTYSVLNSGITNQVNISPIVNDGTIKGQGTITGIQDSWQYDGDLFALGVDTIYDVIITDIRYNEDNTATISCREY